MGMMQGTVQGAQYSQAVWVGSAGDTVRLVHLVADVHVVHEEDLGLAEQTHLHRNAHP